MNKETLKTSKEIAKTLAKVFVMYILGTAFLVYYPDIVQYIYSIFPDIIFWLKITTILTILFLGFSLGTTVGRISGR